MTMQHSIQDERNILLRPHTGQFVIDELPLMFVCMAGAGVRRHGRSAVEQYGENRFLISAPRVAVSLHLPASDTLQGRRRTACQRTRHFHTQGGLHGTVPYRGLSRTPEPPATDLRVKDGSHSLDGPEHAKARPYRRPMRKRHRGDYP